MSNPTIDVTSTGRRHSWLLDARKRERGLFGGGVSPAATATATAGGSAAAAAVSRSSILYENTCRTEAGSEGGAG